MSGAFSLTAACERRTAKRLADTACCVPTTRRRYEGISMRCPWTGENTRKPLVSRTDGWHHARHRRGCSTRCNCASPDGWRATSHLWRCAMGARRCRWTPLPAASVDPSPMQPRPAFAHRRPRVQRLPPPRSSHRMPSPFLRSTLAAACVCSLLAGCGATPPPAAPSPLLIHTNMHAYSATHEPGISSYVQVPAASTPGAPAGVAAAVRFLGDPAQPVVDTRTAGGAAGPAHPGQP
ncbi:putative membrane fusion protein [Xanthomonas citri pv. fuscans]|nr:putative membrane fusion protein [Xanthomonas citri pv. fuscans]